jgi:hypothetical protein
LLIVLVKIFWEWVRELLRCDRHATRAGRNKAAGRLTRVALPNDVPIFEKAGGLSIAMGQSSAEVKKAAMRVTSSSEEGFANAIERFILAR